MATANIKVQSGGGIGEVLIGPQGRAGAALHSIDERGNSRQFERRRERLGYLSKGDGMPRRPVASEVEPNLHHAPRRSVRRRKRPFLGRLDGDSLEIVARTGSIRDGGEDRTVWVYDDSHPYSDVSADGSTGAPWNIRKFLMQP